MNLKIVFCIVCFLTLFNIPSYTQEKINEIPAQALEEPKPEKTDEKKTPGDLKQTEMEIKSSTLPELAAWSRSLGLSESGTKTELEKRLSDYFKIPPSSEDDTNIKVIDIKSKTAYSFKIDVVDEEYTRLEGDVNITLTDKDTIHRIRADEILFNRTRNILNAKGKVEYTRDKGDSTEIFRGENIIVNIDNWKSVFIDGNSERKLDSDRSAYRFEGTVISRTEDDVMNIRNARISNANNDEALWSISASRLSLLPGSDFYIFNAVLKVGEIPVLYIPLFYFPSDENIFHPVIGYRSREGGFVQTSTYILGRPKANSTEQSSITKILGNSNDMEKERHGIFLRSTGKKITDTDTATLKLLTDYYTNLGWHFGLDLNTPKKGILNPIDLTAGVGFTRTINNIDGNYTPYHANNYDGTFDWNKSNFLSMPVPFRYRIKFDGSINGKTSQFSWNLPYYSDPDVDKDFLNRSENMDYMNMIQSGAAFDSDTASEYNIGRTYQWNLSGKYTPSFPKLSPYISSISLSNISMSLAFNRITDEIVAAKSNENPGKFIFVPDKLNIFNFSSSISGNPLNLKTNQTTQTKETDVIEGEDPFKNIGIPRTPWPAEEKTEKPSTDDKLVPPALNQKFDLPRIGNINFNINYQLSPTGSMEMQFMSGYGRWRTYDDVKWNDIQSILSSFGGNGNVNFVMNHSSGLFSNTVTFTGSGTYRDYNYINDEAEAYRTPQTSDGDKDETKILEAKKQQYRQNNYTSSYSYAGTLRPLYNNDIFGQTSLQYNFKGILVKSKRYKDEDKPQLEPQWGVWAKEEIKDGKDIYGLSSNSLSTTIAADVMSKQQTLRLGMELPPLNPSISANATFRIWKSVTSAKINYVKPEIWKNEPNEKWRFEPLQLDETLTFAPKYNFLYYMAIDPDDKNKVTSITSSLTLADFKASFSAAQMKKYEFKPDNPNDYTLGGKWIITDDDPGLQPMDFIMTYNHNFSNIDIIKNKMNISFNVNTRLSFDLQRYTNSNFQFTMGATFDITNFLTLTLSSTSENSVIFRYFKKVPGMEKLTSMYKDGPENNLFTDFFDSFNFFDTSKRERSGFKLKRLNLKATHFLGDWQAVLDISMTPYLNNTDPTNPKYDMNHDITFTVEWSPISEIKRTVRHEKSSDKWSIQ